ncbi:hypothetical protein BN7_4364 [Wickerhamomyces ciferrii]|uniref:CRAL-TRIO domain-containing protein n=1 Tax=Wickerhamomyces ciferrii (strain ATCC 14091 / BCRC 22168 / CBS 111 / JCM 3599 / NBRC 0793 / NRRL Y-1031 F-60-10) TaxID=1206466 RepID=K0KPC6_WICCF|nr:uncharacterized protein BN7_4364 [Wickerhamomyces ciferrii]CCH44796.1 hypothetical protein BN7_4364 [Wickerhamomyces ciferrii]
MSIPNPSGRVTTLSADEERKLKEVWAHFLRFWGTPVTLPSAPKRTATTTSVASTKSNGDDKGKKKMFSKFRRGHKASKSSEKNELTSTRSNESIEANYTHKSIHESFKDLQPEDIYENFWNMLRTDSPDNLILRFLRARKWDSDKALAMLAHTLHWRLKESHVEDLLFGGEKRGIDNGEDGFHLQFKLSKAYFRGYDNEGRPIVIIRPRLHHSNEQTEEDIQKYTLLVIEEARLLLKEPVDSCSVLFDLTDFTMSNMDYAPVKFMIGVFEAHYPESLGKLFIHKAPWIFPPIWNIVKNWLDPVVAAKISFTKTAKDLHQFIPMKYIPNSLGGEDEFEMEYVEPVEGEDELLNDKSTRDQLKSQRKEIITKFIEATVNWIESNSDEESKKFLNEKIELGHQLSINYAQLDPYIRARSVFDRIGMIDVKKSAGLEN